MTVLLQGPTYAPDGFKLSLGAPSQCKALLSPPIAGGVDIAACLTQVSVLVNSADDMHFFTNAADTDFTWQR